MISNWLGIQNPTETELNSLTSFNKSAASFERDIARMLNVRAQLGWATHGHSAVDVNLYAHGVDAELLRGNHENTDIGDFIIRFLELNNLKSISQLLGQSPLWNDDDIPPFVDRMDHVGPFNEIHYHRLPHGPHDHVHEN